MLLDIIDDLRKDKMVLIDSNRKMLNVLKTSDNFDNSEIKFAMTILDAMEYMDSTL